MTMRTLGQVVLEADAVSVPGDAAPVTIDGPEALFEHVRSDSLGRYRPLSGAKTLRTGWRAPLSAGFASEDALELIYPLALTHQRQFREGTLRIVTLDDVLIRQTGRYEESSALQPAGRRLAIDTVCGECVRKPAWDGASCETGDIPCPEPCSVLVAFCREAALWQTEPPAPSAPSPAVAWAAFEEPGNELRERYLQSRGAGNE